MPASWVHPCPAPFIYSKRIKPATCRRACRACQQCLDRCFALAGTRIKVTTQPTSTLVEPHYPTTEERWRPGMYWKLNPGKSDLTQCRFIQPEERAVTMLQPTGIKRSSRRRNLVPWQSLANCNDNNSNQKRMYKISLSVSSCRMPTLLNCFCAHLLEPSY